MYCYLPCTYTAGRLGNDEPIKSILFVFDVGDFWVGLVSSAAIIEAQLK